MPADDGSRSDGSTSIFILLVLLGSIYMFAGIVMTNMRTQELGPLCAQHGWVIIDVGMGQSAKCLDTATGVMYLPPEVFNRR